MVDCLKDCHIGCLQVRQVTTLVFMKPPDCGRSIFERTFWSICGPRHVRVASAPWEDELDLQTEAQAAWTLISALQPVSSPSLETDWPSTYNSEL
jgi:hypothetical protein